MILILYGSVILLTQALILWLSHSFIFGTGHQERPILEFLLLEAIAFAAYFAAVETVRRQPASPRSSRKVLLWIVAVGFFSRLVFLPSQLIQETDPYRYIWDGQTVLQGGNPYKASPQEAFKNRMAPASNPQNEVTETFQKINHPRIKTIYPPVAQYLFAISQIFSPWKLIGWKFMILFAEFGIFILISGILAKMGMRQEWLLLYAWCPLVIKEFSNGLHLDVFAVFFLSPMIFALMHRRFYLGFISLAFATGVKLFPIVLLPLVFLWVKKENARIAWQGMLIFAAALLIFYMPFVSAGSSLFEGLLKFAGGWRVNEGLYGLIQLGFREPASRLIAGSLFLGGFILATRHVSKHPEFRNFCSASLFLLASLFFLAPTGNPWYFTWIFPFLYFQPLRSLVIFSGLVFLYYLDFYFSYQSKTELFVWVKWIEYGIFYSVLVMELIWKQSQKSLSFYRLRTNAILSQAR